MSNIYNIWADGSYQSTKDRGGVGWVIIHNEERKEECAILPVLDKTLKPHGSDYAELYAVTQALKDIPLGSKVMLRMDCQNVLDWLKNGKMTRGSKTETVLALVFGRALQAVVKMGSVEFIKASDKNNENMSLAHQLSRKGALHSKI